MDKTVKFKYHYSQIIDVYFKCFDDFYLQKYIKNNEITQRHEFKDLILNLYFNSINIKHNNDIRYIIDKLISGSKCDNEVPHSLKISIYKNEYLKYIDKAIEIHIVYSNDAPSPPIGQFSGYLEQKDCLVVVCIIGNIENYKVTKEWITRGIDYSILKYIITNNMNIDNPFLLSKLIWFSYYFILERNPQDFPKNHFEKQMLKFRKLQYYDLKNKEHIYDKLNVIYSFLKEKEEA